MAELDRPQVSISDREPLVPDHSSSGRWKCCRHKRLVIFLSVLACILAVHLVVIYFLYFCSAFNCTSLKVTSLNTWGMPATFGSQYKTERMAAIAEQVARGDYDVFLLEELWMEPDHTTIGAKVPEGFYMTGFRQLALSTCDGRVAPTACSGLAIVSRFPFEDIEFNSYTDHGDFKKAFIDGEWLARKGVGKVRILPTNDTSLTVDVFVTHTAADPDPSHGYTNEYYRRKQVRELMDKYVTQSDADVVILGGDFNAQPVKETGEIYHMIVEHMKNCLEEVFYKLNQWLNTNFATYGNQHNTFTGGKYNPVTYDYVFHHTNTNRTQTWTNWFELPLFKTTIFEDLLDDDDDNNTTTARDKRSTDTIKKKQEEKVISFSDHEAVESTIYMWK